MMFTNFLHQNYFILLWNSSGKGIIVLLNESVYIGISGHFVSFISQLYFPRCVC